jgi:hypothetical protein
MVISTVREMTVYLVVRIGKLDDGQRPHDIDNSTCDVIR